MREGKAGQGAFHTLTGEEVETIVAHLTDILIHPCWRCGLDEGAGAAGLCAGCNEEADEQDEHVCDESRSTGRCNCSERELYHERAHAGVSDPDVCNRGAGCPGVRS